MTRKKKHGIKIVKINTAKKNPPDKKQSYFVVGIANRAATNKGKHLFRREKWYYYDGVKGFGTSTAWAQSYPGIKLAHIAARDILSKLPEKIGYLTVVKASVAYQHEKE